MFSLTPLPGGLATLIYAPVLRQYGRILGFCLCSYLGFLIHLTGTCCLITDIERDFFSCMCACMHARMYTCILFFVFTSLTHEEMCMCVYIQVDLPTVAFTHELTPPV